MERERGREGDAKRERRRDREWMTKRCSLILNNPRRKDNYIMKIEIPERLTHNLQSRSALNEKE